MAVKGSELTVYLCIETPQCHFPIPSSRNYSSYLYRFVYNLNSLCNSVMDLSMTSASAAEAAVVVVEVC